MQTENIKITKLKSNVGQIPGLPKNPKKITSGAKDELRKSIVESGEMAEFNPLLVYLYDGFYVVINGNQRIGMYKDLKYKEVPCFVLPENTPVEKLKEYSVKTNLNSGKWDWDALKLSWPEINDWGLFETEPTKDATTSVSFEATNPKPIIITVEFDSEAQREVLLEKLQKEGYSCWAGKKKPKQ